MRHSNSPSLYPLTDKKIEISENRTGRIVYLYILLFFFCFCHLLGRSLVLHSAMTTICYARFWCKKWPKCSFIESRKNRETAIGNSPAPNQPPNNMSQSQNLWSANQKLEIINKQNDLLSKVSTLKLVKVKLCICVMNREVMQLLVILQWKKWQ